MNRHGLNDLCLKVVTVPVKRLRRCSGPCQRPVVGVNEPGSTMQLGVIASNGRARCWLRMQARPMRATVADRHAYTACWSVELKS